MHRNEFFCPSERSAKRKMIKFLRLGIERINRKSSIKRQDSHMKGFHDNEDIRREKITRYIITMYYVQESTVLHDLK
jgi:hypothetical protein